MLSEQLEDEEKSLAGAEKVMADLNKNLMMLSDELGQVREKVLHLQRKEGSKLVWQGGIGCWTMTCLR